VRYRHAPDFILNPIMLADLSSTTRLFDLQTVIPTETRIMVNSPSVADQFSLNFSAPNSD
jgi:hypothetical protein